MTCIIWAWNLWSHWKSLKNNSSVGCDIPPKIIKEFSVELSLPISIIFNSITKKQIYPTHWKIEHGVGIPKISPFLSKLYETFLSKWLLEVISHHLDPAQCGLKGLSITHCLIRFLHFIQSSLDSYKPHTVIAAFFDMS